MTKEKTHKVVRKYYNKKTQEWVQREYIYARGKSRRGLTVVGKNGKINKKNLLMLQDMINTSSKYNDSEKKTLLNDLKYFVKAKHQNKEKLTTSGFFGRFESNRVDRYLINMGYSSELLSEELGVSIDDIRNTNNWSGDRFTVGNNVYAFNSNYNGPIYEKVR